MHKRRWSVAGLLALALVPAVLASQHLEAIPSHDGFERDAGAVAFAQADSSQPTKFTIRLSDGSPEAVPAPAPPAAATPLDERDTSALLSRLPPLKPGAGDEQPFALRPASLPAPRTGKTITGLFPPRAAAVAPDVPATGPLTILRHAPDGEVALAPNVSVTFSQPMVEMTSQSALAARSVPVTISPLPPAGEWRWLGTRTVVFDSGARLPMATDYVVDVPTGTASITGGRLDKAERFRFSTPPPTIATSWPKDETAVHDPVMFVAFDQRIDPAAMLRIITVKAGVKQPRLRLATADEVERTPSVRALARASEPGRWMAFRLEERLPADTAVVVSVGAGAPSAEGPKKTTAAQSWSFKTFGPFKVAGTRCAWNGNCRPASPWMITLSNPIDSKSFAENLVRIDPPLPNFSAVVYGQVLEIRGQSKGRTPYRVTISGRLADAYGQTLGADYSTTITPGAAEPFLSGRAEPLTVMDPAGSPTFPVYSINIATMAVRAYAVEPDDWPAYQQFLQSRNGPKLALPPGREVMSANVAVQSQPDEAAETAIDLRPGLRNGLGHLVLVVEPVGWTGNGRPPKVITWIQSTRIGLDAFVDETDLVGWASSLSDGRPLAGVQFSLGGTTAVSDPQGLGRLTLSNQEAAVLVARLGQDVAMLPRTTGWYAVSGWRRATPSDSVAWYVADDRKLYRPGETATVKGWLRVLGAGPHGDVRRVSADAGPVSWQLLDDRGNEVAKGSATLSAFGGFDVSLPLPTTMNLGRAVLNLKVKDSAWTHTFSVQEFRRPEFEVTAEASEGPHMVRGHANVTVNAKYFAGGALPNADVSWRVTTAAGSFTPPNRSDFTFGLWVAWWGGGSGWIPPTEERLTAQTDGTGRHVLRIDFDGGGAPRTMSVRAEASVQDVNRQSWSSGAALVVHPASVYVGLKSDRYFVQRGEPLAVDLIVVDLDGRAVSGRPVALTAERLDWKQVRGDWKEVAADQQSCHVTSGAEISRCTFKTTEGGTYRISARVTDAEGRPNETEIRRWVAGGRAQTRDNVTEETVTLIPGKAKYLAGETAEILVLPPFSPAEGVLTLRRSGLLRTERFTVTGDSYTLRIPVEDAFTPNVQVRVNVVGAASRVDAQGAPDPRQPKRPAYASGVLNLDVPPTSRALKLAVAPRVRALEPGGQTALDVTVTDAAGQPVAGGEVAVYVVDEAVLSMTGYRVPDPLSTFYAQRGPGVMDHHLRSSVLLSRIPAIPGVPFGAIAESVVVGMAAASAPMPMAAPAAVARKAAGASGGEAPEPIRARTDFNPLALFAAALPTDAAGKAQVIVKLPDNLTRYRVMAVAVAGERQFGSGESTITARLPLMVRQSPPRFLNFGDKAELPIVVQNQTDEPMTVDVAVRATNAVLTGGGGRRVTIRANDRAEVRFPINAGRPGTARFQAVAASGRWSDASEFAFPIWTPATTEAFATYGQIDAGAIVQKVAAPPDAFAQLGGLQITTSSTALQALTDAAIYLVKYPFDCAEQVASRVLAVAALNDVLSAVSAPGLPTELELHEAMVRDLDRLAALQNADGGFALWRRGDESWPFLSVHAAHAVLRAEQWTNTSKKEVLDRSKRYLRDIEQHIPASYGEQARNTIIAYALYVRDFMRDGDKARARALVRQATVPKLSFEALGWLLLVLSSSPDASAEVAAIRSYLNNHVSETAATAQFAVDYGDSAHLLFQSNRRADAIVLEALIHDQPKNDLIPKIVEGLLAHRTAGRWESTQENVFVLLALNRYFRTYEAVTPDFIARAWLGQAFAGEHQFKGCTTERYLTDVPMRELAGAKGPADLIISKDGPGRLYYRVGLQYAPTSLDQQPLDRGFVVSREYQAVDDPKDVTRDANGTWHVRAGARVRVTLSMVAPARRYHVALIDPMPAGFEALNPALKTTGAIPDGPAATPTVRAGGPAVLARSSMPWWRRTWFDHQNLRDERAEAFASLLWEGVWTYTYVARATTPGEFVVPPTRAEEMYHPETFGRSGTNRVVVEVRH